MLGDFLPNGGRLRRAVCGAVRDASALPALPSTVGLLVRQWGGRLSDLRAGRAAIRAVVLCLIAVIFA